MVNLITLAFLLLFNSQDGNFVKQGDLFYKDKNEKFLLEDFKLNKYRIQSAYDLNLNGKIDHIAYYGLDKGIVSKTASGIVKLKSEISLGDFLDKGRSIELNQEYFLIDSDGNGTLETKSDF